MIADVKIGQLGHGGLHSAIRSRLLSVLEYGAKGDGKTDDTAAILAATAASTNVYLPAGTYLVSGQIANLGAVNGFSLQGAGRGQTVIKLGSNLASPLVNAAGTALARAQYVTLSGFLVWNPARTYTGDIFQFGKAGWLKLEDVYVYGAVGNALHLTNVWDSEIHNFQLSGCGDATHSAILAEAEDEANYDTGCNNIAFLNMQVEGSYGIGTELKKQVAANRFLGCKWHSTLPDPQALDSVFLNGGSRNMFVGCNFANGGANHITIDRGGFANIVNGCLIANTPGWGVDIVDGANNLVEANVFGADGANVAGNYRVQSGLGNVFGASNVEIV